MNMKLESQLLDAYRQLRARLQNEVAKAFPVGSVVDVVADRYTGYGIVARSDDCPNDQLPVELSNGNIWWYPLDGITRSKEVKSWPTWIRQTKLRRQRLKREHEARLETVRRDYELEMASFDSP